MKPKRRLSDMGFMPIVGMKITPVEDKYGKKGGILITPIVRMEATKTEIDMMTGQVVSEESGPMEVPLGQASAFTTLN